VGRVDAAPVGAEAADAIRFGFSRYGQTHQRLHGVAFLATHDRDGAGEVHVAKVVDLHRVGDAGTEGPLPDPAGASAASWVEEVVRLGGPTDDVYVSGEQPGIPVVLTVEGLDGGHCYISFAFEKIGIGGFGVLIYRELVLTG
jgi:hypothetical protein